MEKDIGKFKVSMHNFMLDQGLKSADDLAKVFDDLIFLDKFFFFNFGQHVPIIAILED